MQTEKLEFSDGLGPKGFSGGSPSPSHPGPDCPLPQQWDPMETPMSRNLHIQPLLQHLPELRAHGSPEARSHPSRVRLAGTSEGGGQGCAASERKAMSNSGEQDPRKPSEQSALGKGARGSLRF